MIAERENWIDWSKTFLIYLVIVGHSQCHKVSGKAYIPCGAPVW